MLFRSSDFAEAAQELESEFLKHHVLKKFPEEATKFPQETVKRNIVPLNSGNESGPCRDRTDDPQIKSLLLYLLS